MNARGVEERLRCACCDSPLAFRWSDTHGVGVCINCGLPYRLFHYEDDKRVDKPPEMALKAEGLDIAKRYWADKHMRVFPGCYDMGVLGGRSTTYSGATLDQMREFNDWWAANVPSEPEAA